MKKTIAAGFLLGMAMMFSACNGGPSPTPSSQRPTPTPDVDATARASLRTPPTPATPTATPPPEELRQLTLAFARGHLRLTEEWERFHQDFDGWRQGNTACDISAVETALRRFAEDFGRVGEQARQLPRSGLVKENADIILRAVEKEGKALRQLRDTWRPDNPAAFEALATERAAADDLRRRAEGQLADLRDKSSPAVREQVQGFARAHSALAEKWDAFHGEYETFRSEELLLPHPQRLGRLNDLVARFSSIVAAARDLPSVEATRAVKKTLAEATDQEDLALRKLRDSFQQAGASTIEDGSTGKATPTPSAKDAAGANRPSFAAFDTQLVEANKLRRGAAEQVGDLLTQVSEKSAAEAAEFAAQYAKVARAWDQFHQDFGAWRRSEGGCDRAGNVKTLGDFVVRFAELTRKARALPQGSPLGPLVELFIEAAEREEGALRVLREEWRPADPSPLRSFDQERAAADRFRRQAAAGLAALLERYGIPPAQVREAGR